MRISVLLCWFCRIVLAGAFIASGVLKLYPIEFFENDLLLHHLGLESTIVFESRWLIGSEFIIAGGILFMLWDRLFLAVSFLMLLVYSVYLVIILLVEGNSGNCGCFGNAIVLTPLEGIFKNILLGLLTFVLWKNQSSWIFPYRKAAIIILLLLGTALPFILNPVFFPQKVNTDTGEKVMIPLERLYANHESPEFDLQSGKKIVAFLLLKCSHCRLTAARLEAIKRSNPELPIYFVICGEQEELQSFLDEAHVEQTPYSLIHSLHLMIKVAGPDFPAVYLLNNGVADAEFGFYDIESSVLLDWYNKR